MGFVNFLFKWAIGSIGFGTVIFYWLMNGQGDQKIPVIIGAIPGFLLTLVWKDKKKEEGAEKAHAEPKPPKPPRDWSPEIRMAKIIIAIVAVIAILVVIIVTIVVGNWYPTQAPEVWTRIKAEIGIPANTSQPGWREDLAFLVRASKKIPSWPDRENYVGLITDAARKSDLDQVVSKLQESRDATNAYKVERTNNMIRVDLWVILLYVGINVANSLIAFRVSWPLPGPLKSKITTGTILVVVLAVGIWFFWVQPEGRNAGQEAFWWGGKMGLITLASSLAGVSLTLLGRLLDPSHSSGSWIAGQPKARILNDPKAQLSLKVSFAILGAITGSLTDTVFQAFILNGILVASNGAAVMMELVVMYLLGALGFRFIASIIGPYTAAAGTSTVETN